MILSLLCGEQGARALPSFGNPVRTGSLFQSVVSVEVSWEMQRAGRDDCNRVEKAGGEECRFWVKRSEKSGDRFLFSFFEVSPMVGTRRKPGCAELHGWQESLCAWRGVDRPSRRRSTRSPRTLSTCS